MRAALGLAFGLIAGGVLVSVIAYFPFLYLPVSATLRRLDPGMEDTAASLGLGPVVPDASVQRKVIAPLV